MPAINRNLCCAVLLILISSHAALSLHIATHDSNGDTTCALSTAEFNPVVVMPPVVVPLPAPAVELRVFDYDVSLFASKTNFSLCHPRAPPVVI